MITKIDTIQSARKGIICADGFEISIQASSNHYCEPRIDGIDILYTSVELGFPSERDTFIDGYVEDLSEEGEEIDYTKSVYPYVPAETVSYLIAKHGGFLSGEMPKLGMIVENVVRMPILIASKA